MTDENDTSRKERQTPEEGSIFRTAREVRKARREWRRELRWQRKSQRSPLRYSFWGLMLILWAVLLFMYDRQMFTVNILWKGFIVGLGSIFIVHAIVYYLTPSQRQNALGRLIPGVILIFVGLELLLGSTAWWPLAFIGAGAAVVLITFFLQREVDRRRVVQETLHESEEKYQHIIDNANSAIIEVDNAGNITFANRFAQDLFGFREDELLGHNVVGTIVATGDSAAARWDDMVKNIVASPESYLHSEQETLRKQGGNAWMAWTYKPILDESGRLKEILCTGIDRTEQRKIDELAADRLRETTAVEERTRLARDLHDAVSQTLFSTSLIADVLPRVWERNEQEGRKKLEEVRQLTRGALAEMRTLLFELRPTALADADIHDLLRQLADSVMGRARVQITLNTNGACEVPSDVKVALYRIAQEALNNIAKHSGASQAQVGLRCDPHDITLQVIDNGCGFDMPKVGTGSFGLSNMGERAAQIGASLQIDSKVNDGTRITVTWHDGPVEVKP